MTITLHLFPGNWVGIKHSVGVEESLFENVEDTSKLCGLPVTEDRLKRLLGFMPYSATSGTEKLNGLIKQVTIGENAFFTIKAFSESNGWRITIEDSNFSNILSASAKHIHQIQNLFIAITGNELV